MAVTFHTGRQCKEGSREGGQGLDAQKDSEEEEGGMNLFVFGRGVFSHLQTTSVEMCSVDTRRAECRGEEKSSAPLSCARSHTYHHCPSLQPKASVSF